MKHDELRSIAHNVADSLASGCGLMIGVFELDVFKEAAQNAAGVIEIDFLKGMIVEGQVSSRFAKAIHHYKEALPGLCERQGGSLSAFKKLTVRFYAHRGGCRFVVSVRDTNGRCSITEYGGIPGQRVKFIDDLGRLRPKPVRRIGQIHTS